MAACDHYEQLAKKIPSRLDAQRPAWLPVSVSLSIRWADFTLVGAALAASAIVSVSFGQRQGEENKAATEWHSSDKQLHRLHSPIDGRLFAAGMLK